MTNDEAFILQIREDPTNPEHRLIYADYLEEQEQKEKADFLRLEASLMQSDGPSGRQRQKVRQRLRNLQERIHPDWLARLDSTKISVCFEFQCPNQWGSLRRTDDARIRYCEDCKKKVYHCNSLEEAKAHARQRRCVAVDSRVIVEGNALQRAAEIRRVLGRFHFPVNDQARALRPGALVQITKGRFKGQTATYLKRIDRLLYRAASVRVTHFDEEIVIDLPFDAVEILSKK